ncbi:peptidoglycan editing factor PgeF [Paenibacillus sp. J2TS4]|uniref:peptidoglycan editing factor PgeF n=1 Tax=Paenibacillus sp. J2TS4 TaxID=2807194 RepID=UPI001B116A2D|nr:peptidoglycan editing factor PgeF [Paenibacillus sp. J2TS4]GIP36401.1 laccase domain protein [Paenibacillus sp. J2TS4]
MEPFRKVGGERDKPLLWQIGSWSDRYPELTAGFTSRLGGVSGGSFTSLNCGLHVADRPEDVIHNRNRVAAAVGIPLDDWTYGEQIHGVDVAAVTNQDRGKGTADRQSALQGKDAFITNQQGLVMAALFADCVPLYFYDPVNQAAGLAHAGWKGTVGRIAWNTVKRMEEAYGSRPEQILACIGPSIQSCCYEVDERVAERVRELLPWLNNNEEGTAAVQENHFMTPQGQDKFMLDLQQINRQIMIKAGILPSCIEISKLCTSCRCDTFFSHRKEQGQTGRMIAWIGLR